ncbi:SigE family RNA polymerase sigma factor [Nonomuraea sp. NPDC059194]|uniref:SigE family RNA polymerase sigma factor n=1 Tax=Nonomuraea sp. NPDC059194 TaxID=3346764 RepID=UPI0036CD160B
MTDDLLFETFVANRADALTRYAYALTGNPHDAADLVQEALVRLRGSWSRVRSKHDPESYVRVSMTRLHINVWRRRRREYLAWDPPDTQTADVPSAWADIDSEVWRELSRLPRRQRAVIVLRYYEDRSDEEIASMMGVSQGTVRSQASRALDKLRSSLTGLAEDVQGSDSGTGLLEGVRESTRGTGLARRTHHAGPATRLAGSARGSDAPGTGPTYGTREADPATRLAGGVQENDPGTGPASGGPAPGREGAPRRPIHAIVKEGAR